MYSDEAMTKPAFRIASDVPGTKSTTARGEGRPTNFPLLLSKDVKIGKLVLLVPSVKRTYSAKSVSKSMTRFSRGENERESARATFFATASRQRSRMYELK